MKKRMWDHQEYEDKCFFFNTVIRPARHSHGVSHAGLEERWDYACEVELLRAYLRKTDGRWLVGTDGFEDLRLGAFRQLTGALQRRLISRLSVRITLSLPGDRQRDWQRSIKLWKKPEEDDRQSRATDESSSMVADTEASERYCGDDEGQGDGEAEGRSSRKRRRSGSDALSEAGGDSDDSSTTKKKAKKRRKKEKKAAKKAAKEERKRRKNEKRERDRKEGEGGKDEMARGGGGSGSDASS
jgi:hypothetical protein